MLRAREIRLRRLGVVGIGSLLVELLLLLCRRRCIVHVCLLLCLLLHEGLLRCLLLRDKRLLHCSTPPQVVLQKGLQFWWGHWRHRSRCRHCWQRQGWL